MPGDSETTMSVAWAHGRFMFKATLSPLIGLALTLYFRYWLGDTSALLPKFLAWSFLAIDVAWLSSSFVFARRELRRRVDLGDPI